MPEPLVVVGAGGFGRETLDVAEAVNATVTEPIWDIVGVVDDAPSEGNLRRLDDRGVHFLGPLDRIPSDAWVALGVGSPKARAALETRVNGHCSGYATLVHPNAVVGSRVTLGDGAIICAHVSVGTNVTVGRHVHLNPHAVIGHDTTLGDFVSVNPNATISGDCVVECQVLIGASATVLNGLTIGVGSTVGGSACVVKDVSPRAVVKGIPAR